ncbi:MAG TPA: patatin-like phospholipase family protein [Synergistaceae bacterium]|nr:patatin-like phospholipase family protein [Synergistaceae bacterium]HPJ25261.1 patatin-like phospholipase family protein [Synergistaceae bacterium]HPQ37778.1 patatin-like phospholipase family protein [Synergistaceae bacterium]
MKKHEKPKLGLALGSGAARGLAHIGVLHALKEADLEPDILAGTSIGALVGGIYAAGKLEKLEEVFLELDWKNLAHYFVEVSFPRSGLIEGSKVTKLLREIVGEQNLENLALPFRSVATDIMNGDEVVIQDGDLVEAIRASIAVPGVFTPVRREKRFLVDGGMVNPVPVSICRAMGAERIIAVDLNYGRTKEALGEASENINEEKKPLHQESKEANKILAWLENNTKQFDANFLDPVKEWMEREPMPNIFDVLGNSIRIMEEQIATNRLKIDNPDLLIRPKVGSARFLEFTLAKEMITEGYEAAREALENWDFPGK